MPEKELQSEKNYKLRAKLPQYFRIFSVVAFCIIVLGVIAGFYRERSKSQFRLKSEHTQLSTDVVADVNGYERTEADGGVSKYHLTAAHAKTFSDNHQELEDVHLETFDNNGDSDNKMTAESALFVPEEDKNFTAYLKGNVQIDTRDDLRVKTNNIVFTKKTEVVDANEKVAFERGFIRGTSMGALVNFGEKTLDLLKDVEIETFESPELLSSNVRYAKVNSSSASVALNDNRIDLNNNVSIELVTKASESGGAKTTNVKSGRAKVNLTDAGAKTQQLRSFELFENVHIVTAEAAGPQTTIDAGYALFDKAADRYELKSGSHIVTTSNNVPTDIRSSDAVYEQTAGKLALTGNVEIAQGSNYLKGDTLFATLLADKKLKDAVVRGNAFVRQTTPEKTISVSAPEVNAAYGDNRELNDANAIGASVVEIIPVANKEYSRGHNLRGTRDRHGL